MEKRTVDVKNATLHSAVIIGDPLVYSQADGKIMRTSPVRKIYAQSSAGILLSTENTMYTFIAPKFDIKGVNQK